jgi:hypothetical protein
MLITRCERGLKRRTLRAAVGSYQEASVSAKKVPTATFSP